MNRSGRVRLGSALAALLGLGCSPIASFRPAAGLIPDKSLEVGLGATTIGARPYVDEESRSIGQFWVTNELGRLSAVTILGAFDDEAGSLGASWRFRYVRTYGFAAAVDLDLGYAFVGTALPVALRLFDETWLYAAPRLGNWGVQPIVGVPVGMSFRVYDGVMLRAEWQRSFQDFKAYNRRDHFGAAFAYQF